MTPKHAAPAAPTAPTSSSVRELLERRAQVLEWLARLDDVGSDVPARVAERVRGDYQERLRAVLAQLAEHRDAIEADIARLRSELETASALRESATDALEEARLRYRIGELGEDAWETLRPQLEDEVAGAAETHDQVAGELARLEDLLLQIDGGAERRVHLGELAIPDLPVAVATIEQAEPNAVPVVVEDAAPEQSLEAAGDVPGEDFLVELDRAIALDDTEDPAFSLSEAELETRPKPGLKCADCGYTNDPNAWYCGVCGVDLN